ncbi:MAG: hypothetical protein A3I66_07160 [Burkholderiales bacterium RIFCSPLOWO2_02_FULL_57_36]|nr:MAG: hypothetical protein A3I66_07160 [Burkholderiales bacterium RIFCSPLOWO2_02_FULL_57_36]
MSRQFHLAQVNIARALAPMDDQVMAGFVARLDDINALAESSAGFVWRLKTDEGNAISLRPYDDDRVLFNLSVWETPAQLKQFVFRSAHADVMRQRKSWFERFGDAYYALWWIEAGHIPSIDEAKARLQHLQLHGETACAFSFSSPFADSALPDLATIAPLSQSHG